MVMGLRQMAVPAGGVIAAGLLPLLAHLGGLRLAFGVPAVLVLVTGLVVRRRLRSGQRDRVPGREPAGRCRPACPGCSWSAGSTSPALGGVLAFTAAAAEDCRPQHDRGRHRPRAAQRRRRRRPRRLGPRRRSRAAARGACARSSTSACVGTVAALAFPLLVHGGAVVAAASRARPGVRRARLQRHRLPDRRRARRPAAGRRRGRPRLDGRLRGRLDRRPAVRRAGGAGRLHDDVPGRRRLHARGCRASRAAWRRRCARRTPSRPDAGPPARRLPFGRGVKARERQRGRARHRLAGLRRARRRAARRLRPVRRPGPARRPRARPRHEGQATLRRRRHGRDPGEGARPRRGPVPALRRLRRLPLAGPRLRGAAAAQDVAGARRAGAHRPPDRLRARPHRARGLHLRATATRSSSPSPRARTGRRSASTAPAAGTRCCRWRSACWSATPSTARAAHGRGVGRGLRPRSRSTSARTRATCATSSSAAPSAPASSCSSSSPRKGELRRRHQLVEELAEAVPECVGLLHAESERLAEVTTGLPTTVDLRPRLVRRGAARAAPARLGRRLPADQHRDVRAPVRARARGGGADRRGGRVGPLLRHRLDRARAGAPARGA